MRPCSARTSPVVTLQHHRDEGRERELEGQTVPLLFGVVAGLTTIAGGLLALRLGDRINLLLGLTAGIVIGVALFDLLPEAMAMGGERSVRAMFVPVACGLCGYMLLDRLLDRSPGTSSRWRMHLGPASLSLHSLIDGLAIGLGFQASSTAGWVIAIAVLTHDLADGVNTVSLCLAARRKDAARLWLAANGLAPLLGTVIGLELSIPSSALAILLAVFAGAFLYIGACELIPRSYALNPRLRTSVASLAGVALMFVVSSWAH